MFNLNTPPQISCHGITRIEAGPVFHREATPESRAYQTREVRCYGQDNQLLFSLCLFAHTDLEGTPLTVKEITCSASP